MTTENPNLTFETQSDREKVILLLRAHFVTNFPWIFISLIFVVLPPLLQVWGFFDYLQNELSISSVAINNFLLLWYLFILAYGFQNFLLWYFNVYLLTSQRVVDMDFYQLLYRRISSADLDKIEDVTVSIGGVSQSVFNYGDIHIQTAGENVEFEFSNVPSPTDVQKSIAAAVGAAKNGS